MHNPTRNTNSLSPRNGFTPYFVDTDPRPKTHVCQICARDVESGFRCLCIPSQPVGQIVTNK